MSEHRLTAEEEVRRAVEVLLDRIDYVNGADARAVVDRVRMALATLDAANPAPAGPFPHSSREDLIHRIELLTTDLKAAEERAANPAACVLGRFDLTPHSHQCSADDDRTAIANPAPAGLDVERLRRALDALPPLPYGALNERALREIDNLPTAKQWAQAIAREYAALGSEGKEKG